jgi:hypothetical protein
LIDRRQHSSILEVRSFRGADCDTDQYLVVAKIMDRLAVSKRHVNKMDLDRSSLKKLNEGKLRNSIRLLQSKTDFSALENLEDNGDINRVLEAIRENVNISAKESIGLYESKHHIA